MSKKNSVNSSSKRLSKNKSEISENSSSKKTLLNLSSYQRTSLACMICFIIVMIIQTLPLFPFDSYIKGDDYEYHFLRVEAMKQKISDGAFFTGGIDYLFNNGAGYASSAAYPGIMLYIPALLRIAGMSIGNSMAVFIIFCSILSYLTMFRCVERITDSKLCGTLAAALSMLAFYRLDNIYFRFALGEVQTYIFWPLIFYGLFNLVSEDFDRPWYLGIGMTGMLLSHTISTAIACGICLTVFLIYIPRLIKKPKTIGKLAVTASVTLAVTAYYWIPLIELLGSCELTYSHPYTLSRYNTVHFTDLFRDIKIKGMGIILFLLQIPRIALRKNTPASTKYSEEKDFSEILKIADVFLIIGLILCFFITDKAPWKILYHFLDFMQFPWRMYGAANSLMAVSASIYTYYILRFTDIRRSGIITLTLILSFCACIHCETSEYKHIEITDGNSHYEDGNNTYCMGFGEWLPWSAKQTYSNQNEEFRNHTVSIITDTGTALSGERGNGTISFELMDDSYLYIDVPFIWYKGYRAFDSSGKELETSMSDKGFLRLDTSEAASGTIQVTYHLSSAAIVSYIITSMSAAGLVIIGVLHLRNKKSSEKRK